MNYKIKIKALIIIVVSLIFIKNLYNKPIKRNIKFIEENKKIISTKLEKKITNFNSFFLKNINLNYRDLSIEEKEKITQKQIFLDSYFLKNLPENKFNGSILIAKNGLIIYERYSGFKDIKNQIPINQNTSFHIASISKTFTAMTILQMEHIGKLKIDDEVQKYLPNFLYPDITIRQLLCHKSGLNTYNNFMDKYWDLKNNYANNEDIINQISIHKETKIFPTNKFFYYSNTNYAILASIIEKISNMPYNEYLKKYLFQPLEMNKTFVFSLSDTSTCTPSYDEKNKKEQYQYLDAIVGDKNIYTTARDLYKWDLALYNPSFFTKDVLKKAFSIYSTEKNVSNNYGLGWRIKYLPKLDKFIVYHYGWWHGNRSIFIRDIEDKTTIILLSNKLNRNIYKSLELVEYLDNKNF